MYLRTLAPGLTGEDAGEFIAAAYHLGIPHPPGYPLYCLLGHAFTWLPWCGAAWRVNFMSACFAALAAGMLSWLVYRITRSRIGAVSGGLAFAFSRNLWEQALIAEVYTLNIFILICGWWCLWEWRAQRRPGWLYAFSATVALALAAHNTIVLLLAPYALFVLWEQGGFRGHVARNALCTLIAASGMLLYLYLPIRSQANPPIDWGNPETLENFLRVVRREQYEFMFWEHPRGFGRFASQMRVYAGLWWAEFTPWIGLVSAAGFAVLLRRHAAYAMLLLAVAAATVAGFTFVQNFELHKEWIWVMTVFGIPAYAVTAIGAGAAVAAVRPLSRPGALLLGALCACSPFLANWQHNDRARDFWGADFARNVLLPLERDAILVPESDPASFGAVYLQSVEGWRPDVLIARRHGYFEVEDFPGMPAALREKTGPFPPRRHEPEIFTWLVLNTDRPVYFERPPRFLPGSGIRIAPAGLLFRAVPPGARPPDRDYWAAYTWRSLDPGDTRGDYTAEAVYMTVQFALAEVSFREGNAAQALRRIESGLRVYGAEVQSLNNAGVICARYGAHDFAQTYFEQALARSPGNPAVLRNLTRLAQRKHGEPPANGGAPPEAAGGLFQAPDE